MRKIKIHTEDEMTPRYTEGWMMSQPLSMTSLMAWQARVLGSSLAIVCSQLGIPSSGQRIPESRRQG